MHSAKFFFLAVAVFLGLSGTVAPICAEDGHSARRLYCNSFCRRRRHSEQGVRDRDVGAENSERHRHRI